MNKEVPKVFQGQSFPVVAIVGRPNVGKSSLFNRLLRRRRAIVHDRPGVTRDRIFGLATLGERRIWLVDTGGMGVPEGGEIASAVNAQVETAVRDSDLILLIFNVREGLTPSDHEIAAWLRKLGKPLICVVNKVDTHRVEPSVSEFHTLGMSPLVSIAAEHNIGIGELEEVMASMLPVAVAAPIVREDSDRSSTSISFVGRPNVGKSSLVNMLLHEPRMAVSEIPGTTRDVVDTWLKGKDHDFVLIDTAGVRKKGKVDDVVERVSVVQALRALGRSDVAALVLDSSDPMTTQDKQVAAAVVESGCGMMICVNKWDLQKDTQDGRTHFRTELYSKAPFLQFAAIRFVSALTGSGVDGILATALRIRRAKERKYTKSELAAAFDKIGSAHVPAGRKGRLFRQFKLDYAAERVPTFFVWCNDPRRAPADVERYWEKSLGEYFELEGVPLRVIFRRRTKGER